MDKMKLDEIILHLQIIHIWSSFALEHDMVIGLPAELKSIADWSMDAIKILKGE